MPRRQRDYMRTKAGRRLLAERIVAQDRAADEISPGGLFGEALEDEVIEETTIYRGRQASRRPNQHPDRRR